MQSEALTNLFDTTVTKDHLSAEMARLRAALAKLIIGAVSILAVLLTILDAFID